MQSLTEKNKTPDKWNCALCQGERRNRCLLRDVTFAVSVPAKPQFGTFIVQSKADIPDLLEWARKNEGYKSMSDLSVLEQLGVCAAPLITPLSAELMKLWNLRGESGIVPVVSGTYYDQPAFYTSALAVIATEQAAIRAEEKRLADGNV